MSINYPIQRVIKFMMLNIKCEKIGVAKMFEKFRMKIQLRFLLGD